MRADNPSLPYLRHIAEALGELREELVEELAAAPAELRQAVATAFAPLLASQAFVNVLPGLIAEPERASLVMDRLSALSR